jgi:hypothetical protein
MDKIIHSYVMNQPLNDKEMLKLVENKARLITYPEISNYKDINDLLGKHNACIILYVTKILPDNSVYGHWCCVFRAGWRKDTICFFDPYGEKPDFTLKHMSPEAIQEYGQEPYLTKMLIDSGYRIVYNNAPLQKHQKNNAICGRLTGLRLHFRNIDGNEFAKLMTSYPNLSSDDLATLLTSFIR